MMDSCDGGRGRAGQPRERGHPFHCSGSFGQPCGRPHLLEVDRVAAPAIAANAPTNALVMAWIPRASGGRSRVFLALLHHALEILTASATADLSAPAISRDHHPMPVRHFVDAEKPIRRPVPSIPGRSSMLGSIIVRRGRYGLRGEPRRAATRTQTVWLTKYTPPHSAAICQTSLVQPYFIPRTIAARTATAIPTTRPRNNAVRMRPRVYTGTHALPGPVEDRLDEQTVAPHGLRTGSLPRQDLLELTPLRVGSACRCIPIFDHGQLCRGNGCLSPRR